MLTLKIVKDPPDNVSRFDIGHYSWLSDECDLDDNGKLVVRKSTHVQITSQVERTEPEELVVGESDTDDIGCDVHPSPKGWDSTSDSGEHTPVEEEDTGTLEADMECDMANTDADTDTLVTTTGHNDQEDTSCCTPTDLGSSLSNKRDDLEIQFVKVITT